MARSCPDAPRGGDRGGRMRRDNSPRRGKLDQDRREGRCFICGVKGHKARDCREGQDDRDRYGRDRGGGRGRYGDYDDASPSQRRGRDDRRERGYYDGGRRGDSRSYSPRDDRYPSDRRGSARGGDRNFAAGNRTKKGRDYGNRRGEYSQESDRSSERGAQRGYGRFGRDRRSPSAERKAGDVDNRDRKDDGYYSGEPSPRGRADPVTGPAFPLLETLEDLEQELELEEKQEDCDRVHTLVFFADSREWTNQLQNDLRGLRHRLGARLNFFSVDVDQNIEAAKLYECDHESVIPTLIAFYGKKIQSKCVRPNFKVIEDLADDLSGIMGEEPDRVIEKDVPEKVEARGPIAEDRADVHQGGENPEGSQDGY